ncbi:hypothetical protein F9C07_4451 [Aspergillus flavus]|uniref:Uncharacterized protein n=1 Tax=Aspergillus flavus (strain ATCC 200026 / FGSC A1120 / IAM 13836 / NRRL 3357 / JCM 12722 / SRRC 167) TaxID=332952 RepID=A0A7G5K004_ASPFN|nr:uncharacterized protein G4B84_004457 [Aspergillus flavus NRRL3357]KAF7617737.1 hypothetical protein AFLA_006650 [Aspergillus flavus NRRL3357]QMW29122.1 hypothetical protein G4B84_004457 [Aspergillus flavus NRRL3357]QMW41196.1 hypothetical protein G4B11_004520 [Aspergillus flavus]QRD85410.1 hypothetical protein F9C07_4451 [Aspergillus flavus]
MWMIRMRRTRAWVISAATSVLIFGSLYLFFFAHRRGGNIYRLVTVPRPVERTNERTLVIAKTQDADTNWVDTLLQEDNLLNSTVYTVDAPNTTASGTTLTVPMNKGHEVMVYLTYIIEHYFQLSDVTIFMHADQISWHNNDLMNMDSALMVRRLRNDYVYKNGYTNLRCQHDPGCPAQIRPTLAGGKYNPDVPEAAAIGESWKTLFPEERMPAVLAQPCCSQFAVSAEVIRRVPLMNYVAYRRWLIETDLDDNLSGRVWEYLWQWIFTGQAEVCPNEQVCHCEGYGVCLGSEEYEEFFRAQDEVRRLHAEMEHTSLDDKVNSMRNKMAALQQRMDEIKATALTSQ